MQIDTTYIQQSVPHYINEIAEATNDTDKSIDISPGNFDIINRVLSSDFGKFITIVVSIILIVTLIWLLFKYLKFSDDTEPPEEESGLGDDTIEGHDWQQEIDAYMHQGKYSEVVVLCYLRWLADLNDLGVIKFAQSKTPGIFYAEVVNYDKDHPEEEPRQEKTLTLTNQYHNIRYGHIDADEQLAQRILAL